MTTLTPQDPWQNLAHLTDARIALGRAGSALPTRELLSFGVAHAQARDAVHTRLDDAALQDTLTCIGLDSIVVHSRAQQRLQYLQRPDLGRRLDAESAARIAAVRRDVDIAVVIGDGLSAVAAQKHSCALLQALLPKLTAWRCGPIVLAQQCRVALGDEVGELLGAKLVLILLGERPGLSSPDSLGAYLTYAPHVGRTDAERNCVSNIRPAGLNIDFAASKLAWLIEQALVRQLTGVQLKDESEHMVLASPALSQDAIALSGNSSEIG